MCELYCNLTVKLMDKSIWIVDAHVNTIIATFTFGVFGTSICFLGSIANMINIAVFLKLGFYDTINISFFGLAVSDGICLLTQLWANIAMIPQFENANIQFVPSEISVVTGTVPYLCFSKVSALIVMYITIERSLCVVLPLQVKSILTPGRTTFCIATIFLTMFAITAPAFTVNLLKWDFYPKKNMTLLRNYFPENRAEVDNIIYSLHNFFSYLAFVCITLFTAILVTVLKSKTKWRQNNVTDVTTTSMKERKLIKMVIAVSTVFIICFFPRTVVYIVIVINPNFHSRGIYHNIVMIIIGVSFCLESIEYTVNIFIYRYMSSKYRQALGSLVSCHKCAGKQHKSTYQTMI